MAGNTAPKTPDHLRRIRLIERMTELNSRHLKSEGRRGGLELEIARCEDAIARGDRSEDYPAALTDLRRQLADVERSRQDIDRERDRLETALNALEDRSQDDA